MKNNHLVYDGHRSMCLMCGATQEIQLPVSVKIFCEQSKAFIKEHIRCKKEKS